MGVQPRAIWGDSGGVRIEALEWSPISATDEPGLPLVFVGGGTGNAWRAEIHGQAGSAGELGGRTRRVLGVSRRGMGRSDAPPEGYTPAHFAADVHAAVVAAGYSRFALFGHSMGVPISIEYALRHPEAVAGLILGDAPPRYVDFKAAGTFAKLLTNQLEFRDWEEAFEIASLKTDDRDADRRRFASIRHSHFAERPDGTVVAMIDRSALERMVEESVHAQTDYGDRLQQLRCPALVLASTGGWTPLEPADLDRYAKANNRITVTKLPTDHDLGQRGDVQPLHAALGTFLHRIEAQA